MAEERLQKFLAAAGVASRRKAEELIVAGRVKVNDAIVKELGSKVDPDRDLVTVDGALVARPEEHSYYVLYKPSGCVTTAADPEGRPTALEYLRGVPGRVFPVGRLDYDAEGAVLFTDDGELANRLAHPRYGHQRTYLVKVRGDPEAEALHRMTTGVRLEDGPAKALEAVVHEHAEKNVWIRVVVGEGRYHLVKRLCEAVGLQVQRLFRPEFGGVTVDGLRSGQFRPLGAPEVLAMRQRVGLATGTPLAVPRRALPKAARRHGHGPPAPPAPRVPAGERGERVERGERGERTDRGERGDRNDRGARGDRNDRGARGDRNNGGARGDRNDRGARGDRNDRGAPGDRNDRGDRGDRNDRGARGDRNDRGAPGDRNDRGDRGERHDRGDRNARGARGERKDRSDRGDRTEHKSGTAPPRRPTQGPPRKGDRSRPTRQGGPARAGRGAGRGAGRRR
jgi:23S rRNA pseudouridine2605 synthase